jgi:hypothetical protein
MKTKTIFAICFFVMGMILSGYSQKEKPQGYGIRAIRGEDYININGLDFYSYLSRNNWESLDEIVLMEDDSILISNENASLSLVKGQSYYGTLCHNASKNKYIAIKNSNIELCINNEYYRDKGVSIIRNPRLSYGGVEDVVDYYHNYFDELLYIAENSIPKHDNCELVIKDGFLCVENNNSFDVIYHLLIELNDCFISFGNPTCVKSKSAIRYLDLEESQIVWNVEAWTEIRNLDIPKEFIIVHVFWQPRYLDLDRFYSEPIFHFTKTISNE